MQVLSLIMIASALFSGTGSAPVPISSVYRSHTDVAKVCNVLFKACSTSRPTRKPRPTPSASLYTTCTSTTPSPTPSASLNTTCTSTTPSPTPSASLNTTCTSTTPSPLPSSSLSTSGSSQMSSSLSSSIPVSSQAVTSSVVACSPTPDVTPFRELMKKVQMDIEFHMYSQLIYASAVYSNQSFYSHCDLERVIDPDDCYNTSSLPRYLKEWINKRINSYSHAAWDYLTCPTVPTGRSLSMAIFRRTLLCTNWNNEYRNRHNPCAPRDGYATLLRIKDKLAESMIILTEVMRSYECYEELKKDFCKCSSKHRNNECLHPIIESMKECKEDPSVLKFVRPYFSLIQNSKIRMCN